MPDQNIPSVPTADTPEETALGALGQAALAQARKDATQAVRDEQLSKSIRFYRRTIFVMLLVVVPAIVYQTITSYFSREDVSTASIASRHSDSELHQFNVRSSHNQQLLLCTVNSSNVMVGDVRTLILTKGTAPGSAYGLPAVCKVTPKPKKK